MLRTVTATRYVTPLREGGSLPAIVDGDDLGTYVLKFRGAGQGTRSLVAELVTGQVGRLLGLRVPEIVLVELAPDFGLTESDDEIRDLLDASAGLNLALDYLPGAITFDPAIPPPPDALLASSIVCFDAFALNVDRTARNPNLLEWHKNLWLIDHGASLYFHHDWSRSETVIASRFPQIKDHVLLPFAEAVPATWAQLGPRLTREAFEGIVADIPDDWLAGVPAFTSLAEHRAAYVTSLLERVDLSDLFIEEAVRARSLCV